jgi:hypothetical protein
VSRIRIALLTTLLLLPAARLWAAPQYDYAGQPNELYHAEVCNQGRLRVLVAVAYKDFDFDEFWVIDYWYRVDPGKCKLVFSQFYAPNNLFKFESFPLHLAFAFTDSTGVYGAAKVPPPRGVAASRFHLCVGTENATYRVNGKDPRGKCPKTSTLIPASIVWEPTQGLYPNFYSGQYGPPKRFTVALGPNDRAIPVGPQASPGTTPQGPGVLREMTAIYRDAVKGPGAPKMNISSRNYAIKNLSLEVCAPTSVVKRASWSDPQSARARALKAALRQFLASHRFRDAEATDAPTGYAGYVTRKIRVTEGAADHFIVQEVADCPGDSYASFGVTAVDQPLAARPAEPKPAPKAAIPVGPQASPSVTRAGPGTSGDLHAVLKDIMRGPDAPKPRISGEYSLSVCVHPTVVERESWANPPTARTKAFREAVRQFLSSHSFSNVHGYLVYIRVTETGNKFIAEEVKACSGEHEFGLWSSASEKQRAAAPPPAVKSAPPPKAAPEPNPGFGDLLGPGGFIKPLPPK